MKHVQRILSAQECQKKNAQVRGTHEFRQSRHICNRPHGNRAGLAFAGSPMDRLAARQIAPQAVRMVVHVVIALDLLAPAKARPRAE